MSDFEMLLSAWLAGGDVPEDFKPSSSIEFILIDILKGIPSTVDPKSRADILLKGIADKYAGWIEGIDDLRDALGFTGHSIFDDATTPELIAEGVLRLNYSGILLLENKGVDPYSINNNTWDVLEAISRIPTGGGVSAPISDENTFASDAVTITVE